MINLEQLTTNKKDHKDIFNILAGVRILFLLMSLFSSVIELGLSFSILEIEQSVTAIIYSLLTVSIVNIILLVIYMQTVIDRNNQSSFLVYIVEVLTSAYALLGIFACIRYISYLEAVSVGAVVGMIGVIDLLLINMFVGAYFVQNRMKTGIIEATIFINVIIIMIMMFI